MSIESMYKSSQFNRIRTERDKLKIINNSLLVALIEFMKVINRSPAALHHYQDAINLAEKAIKNAEEN